MMFIKKIMSCLPHLQYYCRVLISAFSLLVAIPIGIMSSPVGIKICAITAGIKGISQL